MNETIKLTQYAKGAGCGCKISPEHLKQILANNRTINADKLRIGNTYNDDAAVYDITPELSLIVTADFFMPIVDDAFAFGQIAAANALSDVYAMGGKPITAIALLGWPIDKLPTDIASQVMEGAKYTCAKAGISISGGHTIDSPEPFFGLSVNGIASPHNIKANHTAQVNDVVFMTKPIGVGVLATAMKRGVIQPEHEQQMMEVLTALNNAGEKFGALPYVTAMTDVTGFGLAGHLTEMCEGAKLSAKINFAHIPQLATAMHYVSQGVLPDATYRNWNAYEKQLSVSPEIDPLQAFAMLADPQTNGSLLVCVSAINKDEFQNLVQSIGIKVFEVGCFIKETDVRIVIV